MRPARAAVSVAGLVGMLTLGAVVLNARWPPAWNAGERHELLDLWIGADPGPPPDPTNRVADDRRAARLGARIFRDPRFSANGAVACATCHHPGHAYADGRALARGLADGRRNTPSIVAAAHGHWYFWDGRRDSQWAQALTPLESPTEHGLARTRVVEVAARYYRPAYEEVFGRWPFAPETRFPEPASPIGAPAARGAWRALPPATQLHVDRVFANLGKALAAYQRTLRFRPSRFDRYAAEVLRGNHLLARALLSSEEISGLRLFLGKGRCTLCHRGPLLTNHEFFSLGLPFGAPGPDAGRADGLAAVQADPFNCAGAHSDNPAGRCAELRFMTRDRLGVLANFKTPSLRNVAITAPYMHAGQLATLDDVVLHYTRAPPVPFPEHTDIRPAPLDARERAHLVAFLKTLTSAVEDPLLDETAAATGS